MRLFLSLAVLVGVATALPWDWNVNEDEDARAGGTTCNCGWTNKGRIVGGKETSKNAYPLIVALVDASGDQFCGGTIISPWHVLTAAHCTHGERPSNVNVMVGAHILGSKDEGVYRSSKIILHERYDGSRFINDISIIVTATQMKFTQNVGPACLPTSRVALEGQSIKALGWGNTYNGGGASNVLREVDLRVIGFEQCFNTWKSHALLRPQRETNMCTMDNRKDTCQGDSGGPLIWLDPAINRYTLVALVSYGGACGGHQAAPNTDVAAFMPWIKKQVAATKPGSAVCTKV